MKKHLYHIFLLPVVLLAATACNDNDYETTMGDVDQRLDEAISSYYGELSAAENGWIANIPTSKGIYRFWMDFTDDNRVTMYTDNLMYPDFRTTPDESSYRIQGLQRPTLIFDTYSYLAIINDPNSDISGGSAEDNQGLETDFEFEIASFDGDTFSLLGRRNRVEATLTRASAEEKNLVQQGALMQVQEDLQQFINRDGYCYVALGSGKVAVDFDLRSVTLSYVQGTNTVISATASSYVDLKHNIVLQEPLVMQGSIISGFLWNDATQSYTAVSSQQIPVQRQDEAIIGLDAMLGAGSGYKYSALAVRLSMYGGDTSCEIAQQLVNFGKEISTVFRMTLGDIYMRFGELEGRPYIDMEVEFGLYQAVFTFDILENPNGTTKLLRYNTDYDPVGNSQTLLDNGCGQKLCDYLTGKTFRKTWLKQSFGTYRMGALTDTKDPANYMPGALL